MFKVELRGNKAQNCSVKLELELNLYLWPAGQTVSQTDTKYLSKITEIIMVSVSKNQFHQVTCRDEVLLHQFCFLVRLLQRPLLVVVEGCQVYLAYLVKNNLNYISTKDFDIHKKNELESTFIEILTSSGKNIVGCTGIHRHARQVL